MISIRRYLYGAGEEPPAASEGLFEFSAGVFEAHQADLLREAGCQEGQGYFLAPPATGGTVRGVPGSGPGVPGPYILKT